MFAVGEEALLGAVQAALDRRERNAARRCNFGKLHAVDETQRKRDALVGW